LQREGRYEVIDLRQFRGGYYHPGLLTHLLNRDRGSLRPVPRLADLKLYPIVEVTPPPPGSRKLSIRLTAREGGIGPAEVYVNGKRVIADARPRGFNARPPAGTTRVINVDLPMGAAAPGAPNEVSVVASRAEG